MPEMRTTRRNVKITIAALVVLDVAAVAVLFSPWVGSEASRRAEQAQLWSELQAKTRQVEPLRGMDVKIALARKQIEDFYNDRLPSQDYMISETLGKIASENGVQMGGVKYGMKGDEQVGLHPVQIDAEFSGGYLQMVKFINAVERSKVFFIVDSVDLAGAQQAGGVQLRLKLETYLRMGA
jgi:type IV pilus assembly protein PilO